MLWFLDGVTNTARERNENFGREVMELFTIGRGNYTEQDVVEASRAFTGWAVNILGLPAVGCAQRSGRRRGLRGSSPARHDNGTKTLLGTTANLDLDGALDVLLNHEATATRIAGKLYTELVGVAPPDKTAKRLGKTFRDQNYAVMPLVEAIVAEPAFTSEHAVGVKTRSPIEKLVGIVQAIPPAESRHRPIRSADPPRQRERRRRRAAHARLRTVRAAQRRGLPEGPAPLRTAPAGARVRPAVGVPERAGDPGQARRPARPLRPRRT